MPFSQADIIEIRDKLKQLEDADNAQVQATFDANMVIANTWWDSIKPAAPTTRAEALVVFKFIEDLLKTETDEFRMKVLRQKIRLANEKFLERKRVE